MSTFSNRPTSSLQPTSPAMLDSYLVAALQVFSWGLDSNPRTAFVILNNSESLMSSRKSFRCVVNMDRYRMGSMSQPRSRREACQKASNHAAYFSPSPPMPCPSAAKYTAKRTACMGQTVRGYAVGAPPSFRVEGKQGGVEQGGGHEVRDVAWQLWEAAACCERWAEHQVRWRQVLQKAEQTAKQV